MSYSKQHYKENKQYYIDKAKRWKKENPLANDRHIKKYYYKDSEEEDISLGAYNKRKSRAKQRENGTFRFTCQCGVKVSRNNYARHTKSKTHINYINKQ
tara:strand:- start:56 stop:352 length:297 start_codon:yes stop_codon:yes gene_type:complete